MANMADPESKKIIHKAMDDDTPKRFIKNMTKFLISFNVVSYTVALIIALSIGDFFKELITVIFSTVKIENKLYSSFLTFIITLILIYIFIEYIFYEYLYTSEVSLESKLEQAIEKQKVKEIEKKISYAKKSNNDDTIEQAIKEVIKSNDKQTAESFFIL